LILDTSDAAGFVAEPKRFASGDDVDLGGRACCLLQLVGGTQAQAREESWKKRHVEFPRFTPRKNARDAVANRCALTCGAPSFGKRDVATANDFIYRIVDMCAVARAASDLP
jgi:hypothetical protein